MIDGSALTTKHPSCDVLDIFIYYTAEEWELIWIIKCHYSLSVMYPRMPEALQAMGKGSF
jgi:hypothetical protein